MQPMIGRKKKMLALLVAGVVAAGSAFADKPSWADDKPGKHGAEKRKDGVRDKDRQRGGDEHRRDGARFDTRHREAVRDYYAERYRTGRCPPGLAKKGNGCLPPGQAKKWTMGRPLPKGVVYYDVPPQVVVSLGPPPAGHRYVRVAADILMIAVGTGMVVDAIQDLGR